MSHYIMGFDIGGTKCAVLLARVDSGIELLDRIHFSTEAAMGFESVKQKLFESGHAILSRNKITSQHGNADLLGIGVSCGGPLDCRKGLILSPPHLPGWDNIPLGELLTEEFGVPAFVQNDANACALVEWKLGAGQGTQNMIFLTMGTGFGAGIISENILIEGVRGFAGEVGHVRLEKEGPVQFGKTGTVEAYCSGAGLAETARALTRKRQSEGREPAWIRDGLTLEELSAKNISEYADRGDQDALEVYAQTGEKLGQTLAVLIDLLNPECIVIGSIFVRSENLLRASMERVLAEETLSGSLNDCRIVPAQTGEKLGDYAAILAACYPLHLDITPTKEISPKAMEHLTRVCQKYPSLLDIKTAVSDAFCTLRRAYMSGNKLLVCGNGGSAADAEHIVGELMKGFLLKRPHGRADIHSGLQRALPAIALTQHSALSTAFSNDVDPSLVFAQQVFGYGRRGDVLLCISTSGNAKNCVEAAKTARALGMQAIAMTGSKGGQLASLCDVLLNVSSDCTPDVQELHLPLYHMLCAMLEAEFFEE